MCVCLCVCVHQRMPLSSPSIRSSIPPLLPPPLSGTLASLLSPSCSPSAHFHPSSPLLFTLPPLHPTPASVRAGSRDGVHKIRWLGGAVLYVVNVATNVELRELAPHPSLVME